MNDETNLEIFRLQGFHSWPQERMDRMLSGKWVVINRKATGDGRFFAWVQDWENNETLFCTAPVFSSSEAAISYLRAQLEWLR